jgi:YggT family protein
LPETGGSAVALEGMPRLSAGAGQHGRVYAVINEVIIPILVLFANLVTTVVIVQFILYLLLTFNVISLHNQFVAALWQALSAILDPILNPIRRMLPNTGVIDFSPIALLLGIQVVLILLGYVARHY